MRNLAAAIAATTKGRAWKAKNKRKERSRKAARGKAFRR